MKKKSRALTLIEVILAMWILFIAICFIFEVLRTSYTYITKLKIMSRLETLTTSKLETILYNNTYAPDIPATWIYFPEDSRFVYQVNAAALNLSACFPNYTATQVFIEAKGPVNNPAAPEYRVSLCTILLDLYQPVTRIDNGDWGEGPVREVEGQ